MHISQPLPVDSIPYNGKPSNAFYTIAVKAKQGNKLTDEDFFKLRGELLPFIATHSVTVTYPFGFTNKRQDCLMLCFESSPKLKPLVDELCFNYLKLTDTYRMSLHFAEF